MAKKFKLLKSVVLDREYAAGESVELSDDQVEYYQNNGFIEASGRTRKPKEAEPDSEGDQASSEE